MAVLLAVLLILMPGPGMPGAQAQGLANLSKDDRADISRIEKYLNTIKTLQARFLQVAIFPKGRCIFPSPVRCGLSTMTPIPC